MEIGERSGLRGAPTAESWPEFKDLPVFESSSENNANLKLSAWLRLRNCLILAVKPTLLKLSLSRGPEQAPTLNHDGDLTFKRPDFPPSGSTILLNALVATSPFALPLEPPHMLSLLSSTLLPLGLHHSHPLLLVSLDELYVCTQSQSTWMPLNLGNHTSQISRIVTTRWD